MARSDVHPIHRFESWQVWPGSYDNPPADGNFPAPPQKGFQITRATRIASMGSCFAREIKRRLLQRGFSYIAEEAHHPAAVHASAAWERVYNTFCMRQIFEYTFETWNPHQRWWQAPQSGRIQDPYRRVILYGDRAEAETDFARHREHSRRALQSAEVLILTLGLTEVWRDRRDGSVISLPAGCPVGVELPDLGRTRDHTRDASLFKSTLQIISAFLVRFGNFVKRCNGVDTGHRMLPRVFRKALCPLNGKESIHHDPVVRQFAVEMFCPLLHVRE